MGLKRISMAGADVAVTDERIAELVIEYAKRLGRVGATDTITVPIAEDSGPGEAIILLGPASQIAVMPNHDADLRPVVLPRAEEVVSDLEDRISRLPEPDFSAVAATDQDEPDTALSFVDFDSFHPDGTDSPPIGDRR